jgi:hypothetical protein
MIEAPVSRSISALAGIAILCTGLFAWYRWEDPSRKPALAADLGGGRSSAPRLLEEVGEVPEELKESSGIAISRTQPGVIWSHNDSGDGPNLYAIDITGKLLATVSVTGATARDWEDIAAGPCPSGAAAPSSPGPASPAPTSCLFIADTGDNNQVRPDVAIYIVAEPRVTDVTRSPMVAARTLRFRYPSGPMDAEAVAVRPNGDLTIVSKGRSGTINFYSIPAASASKAIASGEVITAIFAGDSGIHPDSPSGRLATSAAVSPDGNTLAVRTYYEVYFYKLVTRGGETRWEDGTAPCALGDAEPQGEGIDYLDEQTLLLSSERSRGRPGSIHRLRC